MWLLLFTYFHPGWIDSNHNKLDTRQEVLIRDSIVEPSITCNKQRCYVTKGLWLCPYSNKLFIKPGDLDIDHVVPLKEAYESGANKWTRGKFIEFANDQRNLLVVDKRLNRAKGELEPFSWPEKSKQATSPFWCDVYQPMYVRTKQAWHLKIDKYDYCLFNVPLKSQSALELKVR